MKKNRFLTIFLSITGALLLTGCAHEQETIIHPNTFLWLSCSFEEACDAADRIIIGEVSAVKETVIEQTSASSYGMHAHTILEITVERSIKGVPCDTLEYFQHGGLSKRYIIQYEGLPGLAVGERALLFLNEGGVMISPAFRFVIDENGDIQTHLLPEGYSGDSVTLSADEYAALIEAYLEK